jgi:hypothetical protein
VRTSLIKVGLQFLGADAAEADAGTTLAEHMAGQQKQQGGDKFNPAAAAASMNTHPANSV